MKFAHLVLSVLLMLPVAGRAAPKSPVVKEHKVLQIEVNRELGGETPEFEVLKNLGEEVSIPTKSEIKYLIVESMAQVTSRRAVRGSSLSVDVLVGDQKVGELKFDMSLTPQTSHQLLELNRAVNKVNAPLILRNRGMQVTLRSIWLVY